jgi:hypothetical protein
MTNSLTLLTNGIVAASLLICSCAPAPDSQSTNSISAPEASHASPKPGPLNATYLFEDQPVTLVGGRAEREVAPGSAMKERTSVLGKPAYGDLDADGDDDAAVLLVQDQGGSGTFFYLAAAVRKDGRYEGSNVIFLGDRVGSPTVAIETGVIRANFLDRPENASFADEPSVHRSMQAKLHGSRLEDLQSTSIEASSSQAD